MTTDPRPVLVGMCQPHAELEPLDPRPTGSAGWRLWRLLHDACGASQDEYLRAFDRVNVMDGTEWCAREAKAQRARLWARLAGRTVVVLGAAPLVALGWQAGPLGAWLGSPVLGPAVDGWAPVAHYTCAPHPSGRCREYNSPDVRRAVGKTLANLYHKWQQATEYEEA